MNIEQVNSTKKDNMYYYVFIYLAKKFAARLDSNSLKNYLTMNT